jgi:hypothetical protein
MRRHPITTHSGFACFVVSTAGMDNPRALVGGLAMGLGVFLSRQQTGQSTQK